MSKNLFLVVAAAAVCAAAVCAQGPAPQAAWAPPAGLVTMPLWPATPPDSTPGLPPQSTELGAARDVTAGRPILRLGNVSTPTLTVYPPKGENSHAAILVFPGGGYQILAIDLEGTEVCDWISQNGITCVLVKYRVPNTGPYPKSPAALEDAQRAMGIVRQDAAEWGIDPHRVGVLGFSAGAHLSAAISNHYDKRLYAPVDTADQLSCRPDFAVILYPGYLALANQNFAANPDIVPTANTPPTFILQAEDDYTAHVENATVYFTQLKNAKVAAELHIYTEGGHGFGLRPRAGIPITKWPALLDAWLHTMKVLPPS